MKTFKQIGPHNFVKKIDEKVYISFNSQIENNPFDEVILKMRKVEPRVNKQETALVIKPENPRDFLAAKFLILEGDFTEEYDKCSSLEECLDVYNKHKAEHQSPFSTDFDLSE